MDAAEDDVQADLALLTAPWRQRLEQAEPPDTRRTAVVGLFPTTAAAARPSGPLDSAAIHWVSRA
jgi:hypothetical protein